MRLQQFFKEQAHADDPLRMSIYRRQSMAIANIKRPKRKVNWNRRLIQVTKWGHEHANSVKRNDSRWRAVVLFGRGFSCTRIV